MLWIEQLFQHWQKFAMMPWCLEGLRSAFSRLRSHWVDGLRSAHWGVARWVTSRFGLCEPSTDRCRHRQDSAKALKAAVASEELFKSQKNKPQPEFLRQFGAARIFEELSGRIHRVYIVYAPCIHRVCPIFLVPPSHPSHPPISPILSAGLAKLQPSAVRAARGYWGLWLGAVHSDSSWCGCGWDGYNLGYLHVWNTQGWMVFWHLLYDLYVFLNDVLVIFWEISLRLLGTVSSTTLSLWDSSTAPGPLCRRT